MSGTDCRHKSSKLLVFGGNGFIGFEFIYELLEKSFQNLSCHCPCKEYAMPQLTLVSRELSWDWDKLSLLSKYRSNITRIKWNRKRPLENCDELVELVATNDRFDAVIDFSAYDRYALGQSLSLVKNKCLLYIYISSDSIYEVCEKTRQGLSRETDAVRPSKLSDRARLNQQDSYGDKKLQCEELLAFQAQAADHVPYVIFRLPDVFGPRDSTNRLWQYLLWLKIADCHHVPMYIQSNLKDTAVSLVYVRDVASLMVDIVQSDSSSNFYKMLKNETFNLGSIESITVDDLVKQLAAELGLDCIEFQYTRDLDLPTIYPSVTYGPVDSGKALSMLSWNPSLLSDALKETVTFYKAVMGSKEFSTEKLECIEDLLDDLEGVYKIKPLENRSQCKKAFKKMLRVAD